MIILVIYADMYATSIGIYKYVSHLTGQVKEIELIQKPLFTVWLNKINKHRMFYYNYVY